MATVKAWRRWVFRIGGAGIALLFAFHAAFWWRAGVLGGFWGHFREVGVWFQAIGLTSLLVIVCCLFGVGWKRWVGVACGITSLVLTFLYGAGL